MLKNRGKIVACLDIGTTKLVCLIAEISKSEIKILGYGIRESKGIISSAISDMKIAQKSITNVISDAEAMAGFNIDKLVVGLSGAETISQKKMVKSKIASDMVKNADIKNLANAVHLQYKKNNREIVHLIPLQYHIDDSKPITNPRYMTGKFLSAKFHIISTSFTTAKNIENCLKRCQLSVVNFIAESYSSALSSLTDNEFGLGTLVIDIGGADTGFCVIFDNKLVYSNNFPVGGIHITRDIAMILNINFETAEAVKNLNNKIFLSPNEEREIINLKADDFDILDVGYIKKGDLRNVIQSRIEEIFEEIKAIIQKNGYGPMSINNIVLSGGSANINGIDKLAYKIFKKPVRIGLPNNVKNIPEMFEDPSFCNIFGMLTFLKNNYLREKIKEGFETKNSLFKKIIDKLMTI